MKLFESCVYTIVDVDDLLAADRGSLASVPVRERKSWRTAQKLLSSARGRNETFLILLADARYVHRWLGWAELVDITIGDDEKGTYTEFVFRNLRTGLTVERSQLEMLTSGGPLSDNHIRPYVLFKTPAFLESLVSEGAGVDLVSWLQTEDAVAHVFEWNFAEDPQEHLAVRAVVARVVTALQDLAPSNWRAVVTPGRLRLLAGETTIVDVGARRGSYEFFAGDVSDEGDEGLSFLQLFDKYEPDVRSYVREASKEAPSELPHSEALLRYLATNAEGSRPAPSSSSDDPALSDVDARERVLTEIALRRGQGAFRAELFAAYEGRCAISGWSVSEVLEAAHVLPFRGDHRNGVQNGLLLRSDIHVLFDLGLIDVDPETYCVTVDASLVSSPYGPLHGQRLRLPADESLWPSSACLRARRDGREDRVPQGEGPRAAGSNPSGVGVRAAPPT